MSASLAIFMAGYPYSGKSHVVELATSGIKNVFVINPKEYRSERYDSMSEEEQGEENLASWEVSIDVLKEALEGEDKVVIYDTACASEFVMSPFFKLARQSGRVVIYAWVEASLHSCKNRAGENWFPKPVIDKYKSKFCLSKPNLSKLADGVLTIDNEENKPPDVSSLREVILAANE